MRIRSQYLVLTVFLCTAATSLGDVRLPHVFSDHMVLQQGRANPVWGWADPGESVSLEVEGKTVARVTANDAGRFTAELPAMKAGGPYTIVVQGVNRIEIKDVLVGEVWLCSGQSNMQWTVNGARNPKEEIAAADFPLIRHFGLPRIPAPQPVEDREVAWQLSSPQTTGGFTAVGYFFARFLHQQLDVPVGIINASWGGTLIEPWTPPNGFAGQPSLADIHRRVQLADPAGAAYRDALGAYLQQVRQWTTEAEKSLAEQVFLQPLPPYPEDLKPLTDSAPSHQQPTVLYNGMVHPIKPYGIRGALWYQGESNRFDGPLYTDKMKALIDGWRKLWGYSFPFYFVQIAPFQYGQDDPGILPVFWEAQQQAARDIPDCELTVIHDVGNLKNIHPKNKQEVGRRLGLIALANVYGKTETTWSGPRFKSMQKEGSTLQLSFTHTGSRLATRDGGPPNHFEVLGRGVGIVAAEARIEGNQVVVSASGIDEPIGVRFGWSKIAEPNLMNAEGLPAAPFRAGAAVDGDPLDVFVTEADDYELLYDLDLGKLGGQIKYDEDQRGVIKGPMQRVAYLVELRQGKGDTRFVWASLDAFTQDPAKLGLPVHGTGIHFQQPATNLTVISNVADLPQGTGLDGGLEFWPNNYGPKNAAGVPGATSNLYDTGDQPVDPVKGYGCMQIHVPSKKTVLFAVNHWTDGVNADLGIGNKVGGPHPDWTFSKSGASYTFKRLRVFVKRP